MHIGGAYMFKRFVNWAKAVFVKTMYVIPHPSLFWKERREEARVHMWAREMAKKAGKTE